jgi:hypothetical protein
MNQRRVTVTLRCAERRRNYVGKAKVIRKLPSLQLRKESGLALSNLMIRCLLGCRLSDTARRSPSLTVQLENNRASGVSWSNSTPRPHDIDRLLD